MIRYREHTMSSSGSLWERRTAAVQHALRSMCPEVEHRKSSEKSKVFSDFFMFFTDFDGF